MNSGKIAEADSLYEEAGDLIEAMLVNVPSRAPQHSSGRHERSLCWALRARRLQEG
jgi:hypothetical protein